LGAAFEEWYGIKGIPGRNREAKARKGPPLSDGSLGDNVTQDERHSGGP